MSDPNKKIKDPSKDDPLHQKEKKEKSNEQPDKKIFPVDPSTNEQRDDPALNNPVE